jgi:hypothetical protein
MLPWLWDVNNHMDYVTGYFEVASSWVSPPLKPQLGLIVGAIWTCCRETRQLITKNLLKQECHVALCCLRAALTSKHLYSFTRFSPPKSKEHESCQCSLSRTNRKTDRSWTILFTRIQMKPLGTPNSSVTRNNHSVHSNSCSPRILSVYTVS